LLFYGFTLPTAGHWRMLPQTGGRSEFGAVRAMETRAGNRMRLELVFGFATFSTKYDYRYRYQGFDGSSGGDCLMIQSSGRVSAAITKK